MPNRRQFPKGIPIVAAAGVVMSISDLALAAPMMIEIGLRTKVLGHVADTTRIDKIKFPKHTPGQRCGNCALYQGGTAAQGGYPPFADRDVANKGRCSAWTRKA